MRMVERREDVRFALESRDALGISRKELRKNFDGDLAVQSRIRARYTSPMPPAPRAPITSYGPILVPLFNGISFRSNP